MLVLVGAADAAPPVDFNRDIRPLLATQCFACHGPDEKARKAKLRLDLIPWRAISYVEQNPLKDGLPAQKWTFVERSQV